MIQKIVDKMFLFTIGILVVLFILSSALCFMITDLINDFMLRCN